MPLLLIFEHNFGQSLSLDHFIISTASVVRQGHGTQFITEVVKGAHGAVMGPSLGVRRGLTGSRRMGG